MFKSKSKTNNGFTIVETLIAIMVLTIALSAVLNLTASNFYSARYANNEITANYLLQEAVDYIRNDRDSIAFQQQNWSQFTSKYTNCFQDFDSPSGCYLEITDTLNTTPRVCNSTPTFGESTCPVLNYDENATYNNFYTYKSVGGKSQFKRQIIMSYNSTNYDEIDIKVKVEWLNGNLVRTRVLQTSLLNWQK